MPKGANESFQGAFAPRSAALPPSKLPSDDSARAFIDYFGLTNARPGIFMAQTPTGMKYSPLFFILVAAGLVFTACGGPKGNTPATDPSTVAASSLQASFSATLDGTPITGNGVDEMQQQNAAYIIPGPSGVGKSLLFYLWATKDGTDTKANYSMRFYLPAQTGDHSAKRYDDHSCNCGITLNTDIATDSVTRYGGNAFTITITSMTATRVTGTFSGTFNLSPDTPNSPRTTATVTDGKFDIPMATSKLIPS
jgi:hypothetical protein